jgi:mannitol/fructose-specific phosphotransferase system IIA component (Ntr-type)
MNTIEKTTDSLARFTSLALVVPQLGEQSPASVARELNGLLHRHAALPESFFLTPAALCRELLTNTSLDCGMLIAELRSTPVPQSCFALGRVREALPWRAQRLTPVEFICVAVEPSGKTAEYRRVLAALTRLASNPGALLELRAAKGVEDMLVVLERFS